MQPENNRNEEKEKKKKRKIWKNCLVTPHDGGRVWDPRPRPEWPPYRRPFFLLFNKAEGGGSDNGNVKNNKMAERVLLRVVQKLNGMEDGHHLSSRDKLIP